MTDARTGIEGVYVTRAFICREVRQQSDGIDFIGATPELTVSSSTRDGIKQTADENRQIVILAVGFAGTNQRGQALLRVDFVPESAPRQLVLEELIFFKEEYSYTSVNILSDFFPTASGVHWFDVFLDGVLMTRCPFRIVHELDPTSRPYPDLPTT